MHKAEGTSIVKHRCNEIMPMTKFCSYNEIVLYWNLRNFIIMVVYM
jgi:hypothetical protein